MELVLLLLIALFVISYRRNDGESVYKFIAKEVTGLYDKYAPYSFKTVREKSIELGKECNIWNRWCWYCLFVLL